MSRGFRNVVAAITLATLILVFWALATQTQPENRSRRNDIAVSLGAGKQKGFQRERLRRQGRQRVGRHRGDSADHSSRAGRQHDLFSVWNL